MNIYCKTFILKEQLLSQFMNNVKKEIKKLCKKLYFQVNAKDIESVTVDFINFCKIIEQIQSIDTKNVEETNSLNPVIDFTDLQLSEDKSLDNTKLKNNIGKYDKI